MLSFLILAALCAAFGLFFRFALIGYSTIAMLLFGLAVFFLLLALCKKKKLKRLRVVLIALLLLGIIIAGVLEIPIVRNAKTDPGTADYLIVLGAGVNGNVPSLSLSDRLNAAWRYLQENPNTVAIVSGGQGEGENITEAEAMRRWLENAGLPPERIILEPRATTTEENIAYSLEILRQRGEEDSRIAIASSEYHLFRAKCIARAQGIAEPLGVAGKTSYPVLRLNYFLREAAAVAYMRLFGRI